MNPKALINYCRKHATSLSKTEIAKNCGVTRDKIRRIFTQNNIDDTRHGSFSSDIKSVKENDAKRDLRKKYEEAIRENIRILRERDAVVKMSRPSSTHAIRPSHSNGTGEATAVIVASDWHIEEGVKSETVNGRNQFTLDIARERVDTFFRAALKLLKKEQGAIKIDKVVLALLGDFISGNIHEELLESCSIRPIEAIIKAKDWIASGIKFLLENTEVDITIITAVGNHTRITQKVHIANERGNNLEYFMYHMLADELKNEKRIEFIVEDSYHTYFRVYDTTIRFHHGHAIKYGGGIGGLTIPVNKAIAQWNKTRTADLDVFGHWHQQFDGGSFLCNGSIIGYNAFALFIKAGFEPPKQLFFLIDKKRGKTLVAPILFEE